MAGLNEPPQPTPTLPPAQPLPATRLPTPDDAVVEVEAAAAESPIVDVEEGSEWKLLRPRCALSHKPLVDPAKCTCCVRHLACFNFDELQAHNSYGGRCPAEGCDGGYRRHMIERDGWLREQLVPFALRIEADPTLWMEVRHGHGVRLLASARSQAASVATSSAAKRKRADSDVVKNEH